MKLLDKIRHWSEIDFFHDFARADSWCAHMSLVDPLGHYDLTVTGEEHNRRFRRLYMSPGAASQIWDKLPRKVITIDGCSVNTIVGGVLLGAFTLSSANELVLLAVMYCEAENAEECTYFLRQMQQHFTGIRMVFQDAGQALIAACDAVKLPWRRCAQHLVKNVAKTFSGVTQEFEEYVYVLARSTTQATMASTLAEMRSKSPTMLPAIAWIEEHCPEFVSYYFLERILPSFTQISNNPAEQAWDFLETVRTLPLIAMFSEILRLFALKQVEQDKTAKAAQALVERHDGRARARVSPPALAEIEARSKRVQGKRVDLSCRQRFTVHGTVYLSAQVVALVRLEFRDDGSPNAFCSHCKVWRDTGILCEAQLAVVEEVAKRNDIGQYWSKFGTSFLHKLWTTASWVEQAGVAYPISAFTRFPIILDDPMRVRPWQFPPKKPGRKRAAKPKRRSAETREYLCGACGKRGHNVKRCQEVDLDRYCRSLEERLGTVKSKRRRVSRAERLEEDALREQTAMGDFRGDDGQGFEWDGDFLARRNATGPGGDLGINGDDLEFALGAGNAEHMGGQDDGWIGLAEQTAASIAANAAEQATDDAIMEWAREHGLCNNPNIAADGSCFFDALRDQLLVRRGVVLSAEQV